MDVPVAVDYDPVEREVFWTDVGRREIRRYRLNGSRDYVLIRLNSKAIPDGIAVDPVSRLVIYSDTGNDVIAMVSLEGAYRRTILDQGLEEPRAVVVDPDQGLVYYTDWGSRPRIASLTYDGYDVTLVSSDLTWPNGLALDKEGGWLYWVDGSTDRVEAVRTRGGGRRLVLSNPGQHYFDVALLHGTLYFSDWRSSSIWSMAMDGWNQTRPGVAISGRKNGIHAFSSLDLAAGTSACQGKERGGCSQLCVVRHSAPSCLCADGFSLQSDGRSCSPVVSTPPPWWHGTTPYWTPTERTTTPWWWRWTTSPPYWPTATTRTTLLWWGTPTPRPTYWATRDPNSSLPPGAATTPRSTAPAQQQQQEEQGGQGVIKRAPDTWSYLYFPCCVLQWRFFPCLASDGTQAYVVCSSPRPPPPPQV